MIAKLFEAIVLMLLLAAPATSGRAGSLPRWSESQGVPAGVMKEMFVAVEIPAEVFERMNGKSYPEGCPVPLSDLRYIKVLHHTGHDTIAVGEIVCHRSIAPQLVEIFRNLFEEGYPIERMELIDNFDADDERSMRANNTSCFNYRPVSGGKTLSKHAYGLAVDLNPLYNPYVRRSAGGLTVRPATARKYADRAAGTPYMITTSDSAYRQFVKHGFRWGGNWRRTKDYQHFDRPLPAGRSEKNAPKRVKKSKKL